MKPPKKSDYVDYFSKNRIPNPVAVTPTMKQRIETTNCRGRYGFNLDLISASQNTKYFLNRLNQSAISKKFGRFGNGLCVIPVTEGNSVIRLHTHMVLERPEHRSFDEFEILIAKSWSKTNFGYNDIKIKPIDDYDGWMNYLFKNKSKGEGLQSSVDWANVKLP